MNTDTEQAVDPPSNHPFLQTPTPPPSPTRLSFSLSKIATDLAFPFKAAWWRQLNPRLFLMDKSMSRKFTRTSTISMKSLAMASWRTVSPYESCKTKKQSYSIFLLCLSFLPVPSRSGKKRGPGYDNVSNYNKPVRWHHRRSLVTFLRHPCIPCWLPREAESICSCWVCCHPRLPSVDQQLLRADFWGIIKYSYKKPKITKHIKLEQFMCIS